MSSWDRNYGVHYKGTADAHVFHCYPYHVQRQRIVNGGGEAARRAYQDHLNGQTAAGYSPRHQLGGVRGAATSNEAYGNTASKPKTTTPHGGRSSLDAAKRAYHEQLHGETAIEYTSSYKGRGARGGGGAVRHGGAYGYYSDDDDDDDDDDSESEDSDEEDEKEIPRGQGGVRRYEGYKPEKKGAGSKHNNVPHHYYV